MPWKELTLLMDWTEKVSVRNEKWVDRKSFSIEILQALFLKLN